MRKVLEEEQLRIFDETFVPFGVIDRHVDEDTAFDGTDVWSTVSTKEIEDKMFL
jgi:hypothetical protein